MEINKFYTVTNWEVRGDKAMSVFLTRWDDRPESWQPWNIQGHVADSVGIVGSYSWPFLIASQWTWTLDTARNESMPALPRRIQPMTDGERLDHVAALIASDGENMTDGDVIAAIRDYLNGGK